MPTSLNWRARITREVWLRLRTEATAAAVRGDPGIGIREERGMATFNVIRADIIETSTMEGTNGLTQTNS